jgi:hypothetical protein
MLKISMVKARKLFNLHHILDVIDILMECRMLRVIGDDITERPLGLGAVGDGGASWRAGTTRRINTRIQYVLNTFKGDI